MSQRPSAAWANPLEMWMGVAAGIFGGIGLGVYALMPSLSRHVCLRYALHFGPCPQHSIAQVVGRVVVDALLHLVAPLFLVVTVGALWDGWRRALLGRLLLWIGTLVLLVVTGQGIYWGGNLYLVPGIVLALAASVAAVAYRRR